MVKDLLPLSNVKAFLIAAVAFGIYFVHNRDTHKESSSFIKSIGDLSEKVSRLEVKLNDFYFNERS